MRVSPGNAWLTRRKFIALAAASSVAVPLNAQPGSIGTIDTLPKFAPDDPFEPRVRVWLPPSYHASRQSFPTLYMLDGQHSFAGDNGAINFAADRRIARLASADAIPATVIVAIDNLGDRRFLQYMPEAIYRSGSAAVKATVERELSRAGGPLHSTSFLDFLTKQLKPAIDQCYRTMDDRLHTAIFGASMAGVMAGAIFVECQQSFGRCACMSPNWPLYDERMIDLPGLPSQWGAYFARLGAPRGRRLWIDHGTKMIDAGMGPHQEAIVSALTERGWRKGRNLAAKIYNGAGHAFANSAGQMDDVLRWLLAR